MQTRQRDGPATGSFRIVRKACGLALVLAALGGIASAGDEVAEATPEIDPGSMGSALTLLIGGVLMIKDRCLRK
jgi:hypothetical protein